jgi:hypothetical protein
MAVLVARKEKFMKTKKNYWIAAGIMFLVAMAALLIVHAVTAQPVEPHATLPEIPPQFDQLGNMVDGPADIDEATKALGIPARLVNFYLATPADLSGFGIGVEKAIHIPIAITTREGGRKSLYYLEPGEEVLAGIFVTGDSLVLRYIKRETGEGVPARTGDQYNIRLANRDGQNLFQEQGTLTVLDATKGKGEIKTASSKTDVWIFWSCIRIRHETEK